MNEILARQVPLLQELLRDPLRVEWAELNHPLSSDRLGRRPCTKLWEANLDEINLLLTDVEMPGPESGLHLAQRLKKQRPRLKVILVSGYNTGVNEQTPEVINQLVYLAKPVTSEVLLQTIRQSLNARYS